MVVEKNCVRIRQIEEKNESIYTKKNEGIHMSFGREERKMGDEGDEV